jgi:hypothetical protein
MSPAVVVRLATRTHCVDAHRMTDLAMISVATAMIEAGHRTTASRCTALAMMIVIAVIGMIVMMTKATVMEVDIKAADMMMTKAALMSILDIVMMKIDVMMVVGVVIASTPSMLIPHVKFVSFMVTLLVIVGGVMEMIVVMGKIMQTMPTRVLILLEFTQTGIMTLALLIISPVS